MKIQIDHFLNGIWDSKDQAQVSEYQNTLSFVIVGMYYCTTTTNSFVFGILNSSMLIT